MAITKQSLTKARAFVERAQKRMATIREQSEQAIEDVVTVVEVGGSALACSYVHHAWGENDELKIVGVPIDIGAGLTLAGLALFGGLGKYREHGVNLGAGAIASYAYRVGAELGKQAAAKEAANKNSTSTGAGYIRQPVAPAVFGPSVYVGADGQVIGHSYQVQEAE